MLEPGPNAKSIKAHCGTCHCIRAQQARLWQQQLASSPLSASQRAPRARGSYPQHRRKSDVLLVLSSSGINLTL